MKKFLTLVIMLISTMGVSAQSIIKGDMDGDGNVTVGDVTSLVATITGNRATETIDIDALREDPSALAGIWHNYLADGSESPIQMYLKPDGSWIKQMGTNYSFTYVPGIGKNKGLFVIFDADTREVLTVNEIIELTKEKMVMRAPGSNESTTMYRTVPITDLSIAPQQITGDPGETCQLTLTLTPSTDVTNQYISWGSDNPNVATVSNTGLVTMVSGGTAYITCRSTDGSYLSCNCVVKVRQQVTSITLDRTSLVLHKNHTYSLTATVSPENADNKAVTWSSSDTNIATVSADGTVTGKANGTATITCTAQDGSVAAASCIVTVPTPEYVDLGLPSGTLWATFNVGASTPNEVGEEFRWGETDYYPTGVNNSWSLYKWANGAWNKLTKYCNDGQYGDNGFTDDKLTLDDEDDAATFYWGEDWCMPTAQQWFELIDNCTWTKVLDGIHDKSQPKGFIVKSKASGNTNSIFIPASGHWAQNYDGLNYYLTGYYWSKNICSDTSPYQVTNLYFKKPNDPSTELSDRYHGRRVRPVRKAAQ